MAAIKSPRVIELSPSCGINRVVIAPKQNDLTITVGGWNQCRMDGHDAV
jgi:hypothetical protein